MLAQKLYAGVTLRETRLKHGLTQKDLATKLGAYRQGQERLASLDEALSREDSGISPSP